VGIIPTYIDFIEVRAFFRRPSRWNLSMHVEMIGRPPRRFPSAPARRVMVAFFWVSVLVAGLALAADALPRLRGAKPEAEGFAKIRMKTIQSQLDQVEGDYLIVMGDSHAERLYLPELCGLPVLNAGLSGATAGDVLGLARMLDPRRKARELILIVGTNDIWVRRHPGDPGAVTAFRIALNGLLDRLDTWADKVTLITIPPVASSQEAAFPRSAALRFDAAMREVCGARRCDVVDAFDMAGEGAGAAKPGIARDGVHLANYARHVRAAEERLCGGSAMPADARDGPSAASRG